MPTLAILAPHPDDEVWAFGALIVAATRRGVAVDVLFATSGEAATLPGDLAHTDQPREALAARRRDEAEQAARVLHVRQTTFMGLPDGALDPSVHSATITRHLAAGHYDAVATFGRDGGYGHRDHVACAHIAARYCDAPQRPALICAVFDAEPLGGVRRRLTRWQARAGVAIIDPTAPWPGSPELPSAFESVGTLLVDASAAHDTVRRALGCHASQLGAAGTDGFLGRGSLDALDSAHGGRRRFAVSAREWPAWVGSLAP